MACLDSVPRPFYADATEFPFDGELVFGIIDGAHGVRAEVQPADILGADGTVRRFGRDWWVFLAGEDAVAKAEAEALASWLSGSGPYDAACEDAYEDRVAEELVHGEAA